MANNSNRKAIEFMVQGALPPHSTNVLWMDTSVPTLPVLKIFENGAWATVHTGDSKAIELLSQTVLAQQNEITELTENISSKVALDATVAKDSTVAKQQTLTQGIQNISDAIANIDTSDLAKEATLQAVGQDATAAKVAAQALIPVAAAAEAYNTGKVELAQNITAKGVQASADETLPELADKVSAISQESYTIDGGEIYAKQLFGSLETTNYWNLYEVLAQLLSDGRLVSYGGILLAEYCRGYDSIALAGAGSGGAYIVSDLDENGQFKMYTKDTIHIWDAEFDGKADRWVAYCFADEYHDFQITETNTSPRSIFIGRKVGTITSLVNGRISQIVVPDRNELVEFNNGQYKQAFNKHFVLRNLKSQTHMLIKAPSSESLYIESEYLGGSILDLYESNVSSLIIKADNINGGNYFINTNYKFAYAYVFADTISGTLFNSGAGIGSADKGMLELVIKSEQITRSGTYGTLTWVGALKRLSLQYITNESERTVSFERTTSDLTRLTDIELQEGWLKPLRIDSLTNVLTAENIALHMLNRLGTCTAETGQLTLKIGATNLATIQNDANYSSYLMDAIDNKGWSIIA